MAIEVTCPQGHHLRVKDRYAGKTGQCPHCQSRVRVPDLTDDEVLSILGPPKPPPEDDHDDEEAHVHHSPGSADESGISMLSSVKKHYKNCPHCGTEAPGWFASCPHCHEYFPDET